MKHWIALFTKPGAERKVATELANRKIEHYLPEIFERSGPAANAIKPLFPTYLFANIDFQTEPLSALQWTPGLRRIIALDDAPVIIPDNVIQDLREKVACLNQKVTKKASRQFAKGDGVMVTSGPFKNLLGIFDRPTSSAERVQILLNYLGNVSRVQVDVAQLQAAKMYEVKSPVKRKRRTRGRGRYINY